MKQNRESARAQQTFSVAASKRLRELHIPTRPQKREWRDQGTRAHARNELILWTFAATAETDQRTSAERPRRSAARERQEVYRAIL